MSFNFNTFFNYPETDFILLKEAVSDIDVEDNPSIYVEGSQGQVKSLSIVSDEDVDKMGNSIKIEKKVYNFKYEDIENPKFATQIEQKTIEEEQDAAS